MSITHVALIREIASRLRSYKAFSASADGSAVAINAASLTGDMPENATNLNWWVYCLTATNAPNVGQQIRASSWTFSTMALRFNAPGWPAITKSGDTFEAFARLPRERFTAALNDGVGQLAMSWQRDVVDTSLTTAVNQWTYVVPGSQNWERVRKVEIQISTAVGQVGYPYMDAMQWNWTARKAIDSTGVESWTIQFASQPPPGRTLRVFGDAWYSQLALDADVLPLSGAWQGVALSWLYEWAAFKLWDELSNAWPTGDAEKARQKSLDKLTQAKDQLIRTMRTRDKGRIIVPGKGDGEVRPDAGGNWRWLGSMGNLH